MKIDFSLIKTVSADASHYEFIYRLKKEVYLDYITRIWGWDEEEQRQFYAQEWQKLKPSVILYDNKRIGTICVWNDDESLHIERFYIQPEYQNKGIGSHLVKTILDKADKEGLMAKLHVLKINPAVSLYKRLGYEVTGEDEIMYQMERKSQSDRKNPRKYQAVIFDLFGTLVENFTIPEYHKVLANMAAILKVTRDDFSKLWRETFPERVNGGHATHQESIAYICRKLNAPVTEEQIEQAAALRLEYTVKSLKPRADAVPVIKQLKSLNYKVGLISDCSPETPTAWPMSPFAGMFDVTVFSCVAGVKKPNPRIYGIATDKLGVAPGDCLYIGDGSSNELTGALKVGMHPVLIRDPDESVDAHYIEREENWQGPVINKLKEVLNLVK